VDTLDSVDPGDPSVLAEQASSWFEELHGRPPTGVFAAPGRVNLIGEHVDYNGGLCLPMALPHATYAAVAPREDDTVTVSSRAEADDPFTGRLDDLGPGTVSGWPAYAAGVLWALQEDGWRLPGMDVVVESRVPLGAGLSSSAALECSVALGAVALAVAQRGARPDDGVGEGAAEHEVRSRLVRSCMRAESEVAGAPTGGMDQTIAMFGEAEAALLLDCRDWSTRQVPWDPAAADLTLLVVDTRASHSLSDGGYQSRRADCETAARQLGVELLRDVSDQEGALASLTDERIRRRVRHVFTEIDRVSTAVELLEAADFEGLGRVMTASHVSLRDDYEVSVRELDTVVDTALAGGALGARMTGGGFGGSAIVLVPTFSVEEIGRAIRAAYDERGWPAPGFLTALPSAGARRLR
jgi:galactokinase